MLPMCMLSKYNVRPSNVVLLKWLNVSVKCCSLSDSSSSDSDSDTEKVKRKKNAKRAKPKSNLGNFLNNMIQETTSKVVKSTEKVPLEKMDTTRATTGDTGLTEYVNNMMKARKLEKTINVAMPSRKKLNVTSRNFNKMPYEKKLVRAAEDVATTLGGDKTKTISDLLQKVLARKTTSQSESDRSTNNMDNTKPDKDPMQIISKMRRSVQSTQSREHEKEESSTDTKYSAKKSVIHNLLQQYNQQSTRTAENSIARQLLKSTKISANQSQSNDRTFRPRQDIDLWNGEPTSIFENMDVASSNTPILKTWAALEQKELKALATCPPANVFQELILWTEQGKLWKFPIDNEQGMEEEHNVHFSDHVFLECHLKGWCPKSGPIRHFMELVCVGLSKNPYMTVQEKINHIMWYKEYFQSKEDLLQELGAIQEPFPDTVKQLKE